MTWHAKETLRGFYAQPAGTAEVFLDELIADASDLSMSQRSGRSPGHSRRGELRSRPGMKRACRTGRPKQSTTGADTSAWERPWQLQNDRRVHLKGERFEETWSTARFPHP